MSLQQESFLKPRQQDISKKHGKMRTKFDRLVIAVHLLNTYCGAFEDAKGQAAFDMEGTWGQDVDPAAQVPLPVVQMTYLLCEHFEKIWDYLDFARVGHTLPPEVLESADSQQAIAAPAENSHKQLIAFLKSVCGRCWKDEDLDFFLSLDIPTLLAGLQSTEYQDAGITAAVVKATMEYILTHKDRWFQYASSSAISRALWRLVGNAVKDKGLVMYVACVAAKLLAALGLGAVVRTVKVPGGGNPNWWFVAKQISAHDHGLLNVFGIHDGSTPSLKALTDRNASELVMPTRAPPEVQWGVAQRQTCADVLKYVGIALPGGAAAVANAARVALAAIPSLPQPSAASAHAAGLGAAASQQAPGQAASSANGDPAPAALAAIPAAHPAGDIPDGFAPTQVATNFGEV